MIRYALRCEHGHDFDGWFRSADQFDRLRNAGQVLCSQCGAARVDKALMAPSVPSRAAHAAPAAAPAAPEPSALERLRRHVETHSSYVGPRFAAEARAMHEGETAERLIHGEANLDEVRGLVRDGIAIAPLPFTPRQKLN